MSVSAWQSLGDGHASVVEIHKLWTVFRNDGGEQVVHRDLDLTIERGEILSLVGGSGTGKTVLLRQILGLEKPTHGEVSVFGAPPAELSAAGAAKVGMLFQRGALFSAFNVLDNIAFALRELKVLPDELIRDAAMVRLQMVVCLQSRQMGDIRLVRRQDVKEVPAEEGAS